MYTKIIFILFVSALFCYGADEDVTPNVSNDIDEATSTTEKPAVTEAAAESSVNSDAPPTTSPTNSTAAPTTEAETPPPVTSAAPATNASTAAITEAPTTTLVTVPAKLPCNDSGCPPFSVCMEDTYCACPDMAKSNDTMKVCGNDDVTYANEAQLENASCKMNKIIGIASNGECEASVGEKKGKSKTIIIIVVLVILLVIIITISAYWVWKKKKSGDGKLKNEKSGDALL